MTVSRRFPILLATPLCYMYLIYIEKLTNHCVEAGMLSFPLDLPFLKVSIVKIYQWSKSLIYKIDFWIWSECCVFIKNRDATTLRVEPAKYWADAVTMLTTEVTGLLQIPASYFWPRLFEVSWQPHSQLSHRTQNFSSVAFFTLSIKTDANFGT